MRQVQGEEELMVKKLSQLKAEEHGTVIKISGAGKVHRILLQMGLAVGCTVTASTANILYDRLASYVAGDSDMTCADIADNICVEIV